LCPSGSRTSQAQRKARVNALRQKAAGRVYEISRHTEDSELLRKLQKFKVEEQQR
jgi:hypothetical protein